MSHKVLVLVTLLALSVPVQALQYTSESQSTSKSEVRSQKRLDKYDLLAPRTTLKKLEKQPYAKSVFLQRLAAESLNKGDNDKAIKYIEQIVELNVLAKPLIDQLRNQLAQLYALRGKHHQAIKSLEQQLKASGNKDPQIAILLANAYLKTEQPRKAQRALRVALRYGKKPPDEWRQLKLALHLKLKQWPQAQAMLEQRLKKNPADKTLWIQLASVLLQRRQSKQAMAVFDLAHRNGALTDGADYVRLAQLFMQAKAPYYGASVLQKGLQAQKVPNEGKHWELLSTAWLQARENTLAIPALQTAAKQLRKAELFLRLGQVQMQQGQWQAAAEALQTALGLRLKSSQQAVAMLSLGAAQFKAGKADLARRTFQQASTHRRAKAAAEQWLNFLESDLELSKLDTQVAAQSQAVVAENSQFAGFAEQAQPDSPARVRTNLDPSLLTPVGAQLSANAAATIPEWTGGLQRSQLPAGFQSGQRLLNPYAADKPLFVIDHNNYRQHLPQLSSGHRALLKRDESYRLPVYPTRRSAIYPKAIYEATLANDGVAKVQGTEAIRDAKLGFPFRRPAVGAELIWNHKMRYRGNTAVLNMAQAVVPPDNDIELSHFNTELLYTYGSLSWDKSINDDNTIVYLMAQMQAPVKVKGDSVLVHETADHHKQPRNVWIKSPKLAGRVRRVPSSGYDAPSYLSAGLQFIDQIDMYNGPFDAYVWKLVGKREMVVPYNAYALNSDQLKFKDLLTPDHLNQQHARYELHRVWVVEATLRGGNSHQFGTRIYYVDEDSWSILMVDNYDPDGDIWRFQEGHASTNYDHQFVDTGPNVIYDIKDKRYFVTELTNEFAPARINADDFKRRQFTPAAFGKRRTIGR